MSRLRRPAFAFALAWALFGAAALVPRALRLGGLGELLDARPWLPHALVKVTLAALALLAMRMGGGGKERWGLVRARDPRWLFTIARGALLGAGATVLIIVTPARGMTWLMRDLGLPGMVLWVWIVSSVAEELFVRGWFQGFVAPARTEPLRMGRIALPPRALLSSALFGSLHLTLLGRGADRWTVVLIVLATSALGLAAALDRERSGSLGPPIAAHVAFNVAGMLAGIVTTILYVVATGAPPSP